MPLRRVTRSFTKKLRLLPNPQDSCGREIPTTRIGRKRAWWACGHALETFEQDIQDDLDAALRNTGLGYADIYARLYMIGSQPETATPIIMICCTNRTVRCEAESSIRGSGLLKKYPEFGLGSSPLPLEQPSAAVALASEAEDDDTLPLAYAEYSYKTDSPDPKLGRRLFVASQDGLRHRSATGGPVLQVGQTLYQLTVNHILDVDTPPNHGIQSTIDLDECLFDGQSEDEDDDTLDRNNDYTGRGSLTPESRNTPWAETQSSDGTTQYSSQESPTNSSLSPCPCSEPTPADLPDSGTIKSSSYPDYTLVPVDAQSKSILPESTNIIQLPAKNDEKVVPRRTRSIKKVASIGRTEKKVFVVTASAGVVTGVLIPGVTHFREASSSRPTQKMYAIQLDGVVVEGDCGSAVVDCETGDFYGHIVRGCPGTHLAYIIAATEIFDDIMARFGRVGIATTWDIRFIQLLHRNFFSGDATSLRVPDNGPLPMGSFGSSTDLQDIVYPNTTSKAFDHDIYPYQPETDTTPFLSIPSDITGLLWDPTPIQMSILSPPPLTDTDSMSRTTSAMSTGSTSVSTGPSIFQPDHMLSVPDSNNWDPFAAFTSDSSLSIPQPVLPGKSLLFASSLSIDQGRAKLTTIPPATLVGCYPSIIHPDVSPMKREGPPNVNGIQEFSSFFDAPVPIATRCASVTRAVDASPSDDIDRPEKCPITTCRYHVRGFTKKFDKNRHTLTHYKGTMVCGFCPGPGTPAEKSFNRADVFKRHLAAVHGVQPAGGVRRKKSSSPSKTDETGTSAGADGSSLVKERERGQCTICSQRFSPQDFYDHLDDCVLRVVQLLHVPEDGIDAKRLAEIGDDEEVQATLEKHALPPGIAQVDEKDEDEDDIDEEEDNDNNDSKLDGGKKRGLTYSKGGVSLPAKKRRKSPSSWGAGGEGMRLKKRVVSVFDRPGGSGDGIMLSASKDSIREGMEEGALIEADFGGDSVAGIGGDGVPRIADDDGGGMDE